MCSSVATTARTVSAHSGVTGKGNAVQSVVEGTACEGPAFLFTSPRSPPSSTAGSQPGHQQKATDITQHVGVQEEDESEGDKGVPGLIATAGSKSELVLELEDGFGRLIAHGLAEFHGLVSSSRLGADGVKRVVLRRRRRAAAEPGGCACFSKVWVAGRGGDRGLGLYLDGWVWCGILVGLFVVCFVHGRGSILKCYVWSFGNRIGRASQIACG